MKFFAEHKVGDICLHEEVFDTASENFQRSIMEYCVRTGDTAKDFVTFAIAEKVKENQQNYYDMETSVEIFLQITFGSIYDKYHFSGSCHMTVSYTLEATDPGTYQNRFVNMRSEIAHLLLAKYQYLFNI